MKTDTERWKKVATEVPTWDERNKLIARMIPSGSSIIDVGAGKMTLREYLPEGCTYQPVDCVQGCDETVIAEFNEGIIPQFEQTYDIAVCSGILEYIKSPLDFMRIVSGWADKIILSYAILEFTPAIPNRRGGGWINDMGLIQLDDLFFYAGLNYRIRAHWSRQLIYELKKR